MEKNLQVIKNRIALARKESGYTQEEMARLLNISQPAYSTYESGDKPLPIRKIKLIAQILEKPSSFFLGDGLEDTNLSQDLSNIAQQLTILNGHMARIASSLEKLAETR